MNQRIGGMLILAAGYAMSSELDLSEDDSPQESGERSEDVIQALEALSDDDKEKVVNVLAIAAGTALLLEGRTNEETAQFVVQEFLNSDDTEWWRCDDSLRFTMDGGCGRDGCPVTLGANHKMVLGQVAFAGSESYAQYEVQGLEREWNWCLRGSSFQCKFVLQAGGDGVYYDFNAPSTTISPDGQKLARPAARFECERFSPPDDTQLGSNPRED